jgi:hypothetical protein
MSVIYKENMTEESSNRTKLLAYEMLPDIEKNFGKTVRIEHQKEFSHLEQIRTLGSHCITY